ncbi:VCBS domain-containing protein [Vibrio mediterranei]|uniref:VCBS domain-containing protein n=1 Tax=Vibrio mediterranei TaxID=689 RepID=UPI001EFD4957|nr:VCBS domain-containing protein [Vibrio mediterranei]
MNDSGRWKFELDNDSEMTDALAKGEKVTLNYVVVVTDEHGAEVTQAVSIIVKGTNDAPVIDSAKDIGRVREAGDGVEGKDVTRGRIEASDVDNGSELSYSVQDGGNTDYGTFSVNDSGRWKFELDNDSEMTDALAKGEKVTLNYVVVVTDEHGAEVTQAVSIIVKGTNDAPVIDSAKDIGRVREAGDGVEGKDVTRGRIEASDVDNGSELSYSVQDGGNTDYGTFSVNDNGRWKFELDNNLEATQQLTDGDKVRLEYTVIVTDEHGASVEQLVTIIVKGTNDGPASEDFSITLSGDDAIPVIFDTGEGSIEGDGTDHISDYEDDRSTTDGKTLSVVITELPLGGTLLYTENGATRAIVEADLHIEGGANGTPFNPDNISYLPDESAQGFVLGIKDSQGLDSEASSQTDFLNWGSPGDNPGERILTLGDDSIRITSTGGDLTQYRGDANHVGFGLGVGGGQGINEGETISIDFSERPATSVTLGLDGLGGYFDENLNNANESSVLVTVTLSDGSTRVLDPIQKTTSGNSDLDLDLTISIDDLSGAEGLQIYGVTVGTEGNGNWELRYLETSLEDSFDYKALDSDGAFSNESTVTIDDQRTNLAPDAIDDPESYTLVQGDMGAGDQGWDMVDSIQAKYDGHLVNYNIDGTDRIGIPDGTTNGGPESQIQYNRGDDKSEQLIITLKEPAVDGAFSVTNLFANEGGAGSHEQGKWSAYLGDTLVASDYFNNESGNKGTFDIETGGFAYDTLVFESVDFTGGPARGTDSSDYFLQGIEVVGAGAYVFDHDEPVVIPLSEILSNDDAVDGDDIRITYVFGETQGDARIEGDNVIFDLPEGFAGRTEFQYQITDDKGGFDTATVNVLVNPGPISVSGLEIDTASVEEGESFSYNVTLDGSSNVKTFFDIEFGANGDDASANDVDPSTMTFSNGVTYNEVTGELEVPANVSDFTITLPTIDDNRYEGDEGFTLIVDGQSAAGDILDNDPITLSLSGGGEVSEDAGSVPFTLSLSNPSDVALTVALDRIDVDTDDDDFSTTTASYNDGSTDVLLPIVNGEITIPAGVINVNIQVGIQDNDVYEQDENFTLKVTEPAGLTVNGNVGVSANATISDDGQIDGQPGGDNDNEAPILDLDASESGTGYAATFTEGDAPIKVVDSDMDITDDIDVITSAEIKLTNPQANDSFVVNGTLPNGLSYISSTVAGALTLTISGEGTAEDYEAALQLLEFSNDSEDPNTDPRSITIQVFDDQGVGSNTAKSTIAVVPVNDLPESEDFSFSVSGNDPVSVIFDTGTGSIEGDGTDHISDIEDDMNGQQVHVKITELPIGGTLYHDGEVITQTNVANGDTFDPTKITYEPDSDAQGFILGTKVVPTSSDMESTQDEFYNWGTEVDGKNRVLELSNSDGSTDNITINSNKGNLTQYRGDVQDNHVGHGLGIGGGQGINEGEWLSINFADRPATHVTLGLDGMGGYFYSGLGGQNESAVTIKVTLSNGDTVNYTPDVQKDTSGNDVLFHELSFSIDDLGDVEEGVLIAGVSVGTDGRGNWELRYLETALNDSFKYKAVDSDEGESPESIVTIVDERVNNMPPTLDLDLSADGTGFDTNYQEGDSAIEVVDSDITIFDEKNVIHEAEIVFTNPKAGDNFGIDGATNPLLSGISYTTEVLDSGAIKITLSGEATPADYEAAIQLIEFSNSSQSPDDEDRVIEITTFDDAMQPSNTAVSTINFTAIADLVVAAAIGDEDNKIALDIQLPANSDATEVVISGIPEGATLFSGTDEIVVTNNAANILPSQLANLSIKPPQDSDVDFTLSVSGRDADDNVVEQHDLAVTVRPITDTPTLIVTGENIVSAINFENINLEQNSYGALLDNIVLSTRSNVGYEDTFIDISDISASLNDADGSEVLTLLIQGLPQGAVVTNGTQTSIIGSSGEVDISDWSDLNDLQIKVADVGTYPITIKAIASELDATYSPVDEVVSESINLIVLDNPEPSAPNTPPEVIDFEFFAPDDTIPLNFSDFATDSEDDASNTKATLVEITDEPEYGQLYFLSNSGERFDLDVGDVVEDSVDIFYDLEVGFDVSALGYNPQGDEPFGNDIVVTGGTYDGDKPHLGVEMEEIAFDSAGAAKQSGFYTKRDDERGQGKETEAKQSEFMSIKFSAGMMTRALVGVGSLTGQFSAAANGNGAAQVFVYLYAGGVLLDDNPIVMDNGVIDDHQAIIEVASDIPFDEMRIMPFNAEGKDAGFVLQSVKVTDGEVADQFDYRAIDSDGLPSLETATVNVNIMPNGNVDESEEVDYAVQGGSGVTVIHGTDGDDVLSGGLGNDVLTGGLGDDTFKWSEGDLDGSHDVITDFSQVEGNRDVIDLSEVFEDSNTSLEALLDNVAVGGDKITLTENDDNTSTLVNVTKGDKSVTIELEGVTGLSELDVQQLSNIIIIHDT